MEALVEGLGLSEQGSAILVRLRGDEGTCRGGHRRCGRAGGALMTVGLLSIAAGPHVSAQAQTLGMAQQSAFEESFVLRSDKARQDGAEARLRGTLDAFLPSVALVGAKPLDSKIKYHPDLPVVSAGVDATPRYRPNQYGITADLPLFDGFQRWNTLQSARALAAAGRAITGDTRQQLLLDTAAAYLAVIRDRKILGHRQRQLASLQTVQRSVEAQFAVNDATRTDLALAASRVADARAGVAQAATDLTASDLDFIRLTGQSAGRVSPPRPPSLPRSEAEAGDLARGGNPRLAAARLDAQAAGFLAEAAKGALLPQVSLQFTHGRQTDITPTLRSIRETSTTIQARIPLYEPGAYPKIAEASALAQQKWYDTQDAALRTVTAARATFQRRAGFEAQTAILAIRVRALRAAVRGYEIERGAGFRTILDELNSRSELAQAEILLATGEAERDRLAFALAALIGRLGESIDPTLSNRIAIRPPAIDPLTTGSLAKPDVAKPDVARPGFVKPDPAKPGPTAENPSLARAPLRLPPSLVEAGREPNAAPRRAQPVTVRLRLGGA